MCNKNFKIGDHKLVIFGASFKVRSLLTGLAIFSAFMLLMGLAQLSTPNLPGNDGYYHIKMAYLMRTDGIKPDFNWLPLTILNPREFYNHHFLFHVLLIPFTFGNLIVGAKWAVIIFSSFSFLLVWRLLNAQKVPYAAVWSFGLMAISEAFIYRMSLPRAQMLSLAVLVIALHWMLKGKYQRLIILGFIYVWFYNAFPLLLVVAGAYTLGLWSAERRLDFRPLFFSAIGIAAGLIINPYFPYNLVFIFQHIVPKLVETTSISVGSEWYPYTTGQLLENSPLSLAAFVSGIIAIGLHDRRMKTNTATSLFLAILFGLMLFRSRRFIEYFPPFALIFTSFAWAPFLSQKIAATSETKNGLKESWHSQIVQYLPLIILVIVMLPMGYKTLSDSQKSLQGSKPYTLYADAAGWLIDNTYAGERVFQTDWDDFPRLFFYNTHNTYLVGLDPTYMQQYDPDLYSVWVEITQGNIQNPSQLITQHFGANYVISDLLHVDFIFEAKHDPNITELYRDSEAVIFYVSEE